MGGNSEPVLTCWSDEGRKGYASSFDVGTPEEHQFWVKLDEGAGDLDKQDCKDAFERIIHSCDGESHNPMNWKYGGELKEGKFTYQINMKRNNRPTLIKEPYGTGKGTWYPFEAPSVYKMKGAGWATWDWGQKGLLKNAKSCVGGGLTQWKFKYYDEPDDEGMEWEASFRTVVWVKRCFKNKGLSREAV